MSNSFSDSLWIEFLRTIENDSNRKESFAAAADSRPREDIVVLSSDSEDENENETIWSTYAKSKGFKKLWEKARFLIFHRIITSYSNAKNRKNPSLETVDDNQFSSYQQLSNDLRKFQQDDTLKNEELAYLWKNVIHWLIAIKQSSGPLDLNHDEKFNLILIDFMVQYLNYNTKLHCNKSNANQVQEIQEVVGQIMQTMTIIFNGQSSLIVLTLLRIELNSEYHQILDPIFRKCLTDRSLYQKNDDFVVYIRLVLCFKRWKMITALKADREKINEIAVGKSTRCLQSETSAEVVDLTSDPFLPKCVPNLNDKNKAFASISDLIRYAMAPENKAIGTRILLVFNSLDLENAISTYFRLYERLITGGSVCENELTPHVSTKPRSVNARLQHKPRDKHATEKPHLSKICDKPINESDISIIANSFKSSNISNNIYIHLDLSDDDDDEDNDSKKTKITEPKSNHSASFSEKNNLCPNADICSIPIVSNISIPTTRCRLLSVVASKPTRKEEHCIPGVVSSTTGQENITDKANTPRQAVQETKSPDSPIVGSINSNDDKISSNETNFPIVQDHLLSSTSEGVQKTPPSENIVFSTPTSSSVKLKGTTPSTNAQSSSGLKQVTNNFRHRPPSVMDEFPTCARNVKTSENELTLQHIQIKEISKVNTQLERSHKESHEITKPHNTKAMQINPPKSTAELSLQNSGKTDVSSQTNKSSEDRTSSENSDKLESDGAVCFKNAASETDKGSAQFKHLNVKQSVQRRPEPFAKHKTTNLNDAKSAALKKLEKSDAKSTKFCENDNKLITESSNNVEEKSASLKVAENCSNVASQPMINPTSNDNHDARSLLSETDLTHLKSRVQRRSSQCSDANNKERENEEEHITPSYNSEEIIAANVLLGMKKTYPVCLSKKVNSLKLKKCVVKIKRLTVKDKDLPNQLLAKNSSREDLRIANNTEINSPTSNITEEFNNADTVVNSVKTEEIAKRTEDKDSDDTANEVIANLRLLENSSKSSSIDSEVDLCSNESYDKNLQPKELTNELDQAIETVLQLKAVTKTNTANDCETVGLSAKSPNKLRSDVLTADDINAVNAEYSDILNFLSSGGSSENFEDFPLNNIDLMNCEFMNYEIFTNTETRANDELLNPLNPPTLDIGQFDCLISGYSKPTSTGIIPNPHNNKTTTSLESDELKPSSSVDIGFDFYFSSLTQPCEKNNETIERLGHPTESLACDSIESSTLKNNEINECLERPIESVACDNRESPIAKTHKKNNEINQSLETPTKSAVCDNVKSSTSQSFKRNNEINKSSSNNKIEIKQSESTKKRMSTVGTCWWKEQNKTNANKLHKNVETKTTNNTQKSVGNELSPVLNSGDRKTQNALETTKKDLKNYFSSFSDLSGNTAESTSGQAQAIVRLQNQTNRLEIIDTNPQTFTNTTVENGSHSSRSSTPTLDEQISYEISKDRPKKRDASPQSKAPLAKKSKIAAAATTLNANDVFDMLKHEQLPNVVFANALNTECKTAEKLNNESAAAAKKSDLINNINLVETSKNSDGQQNPVGDIAECGSVQKLKMESPSTKKTLNLLNDINLPETQKNNITECGSVQELKIVSPSTAKKPDLINVTNLVDKPNCIDRQLNHSGGITESVTFEKLKIVSPSTAIKPDLINATNLVEKAKNSDITECGTFEKLKIVTPTVAKKSDPIKDTNLVEKPKNSDIPEHSSIQNLKILTPSTAKKSELFKDTNLVGIPKNSEVNITECGSIQRIKIRSDLINENFMEKPKNSGIIECESLQKLKNESPKKSDSIKDTNLVKKSTNIAGQQCQIGDINTCGPLQKRRIDIAECKPLPKLKIVSPSPSIAIKSELINKTNLVQKPTNSDVSKCGLIPKVKIVSPLIEKEKESIIINNSNLVEKPKNIDFTECVPIPKVKIVSPSTANKSVPIVNTNLVEKPKSSGITEYGSLQKLKIVSPAIAKKSILINNSSLVEKTKSSDFTECGTLPKVKIVSPSMAIKSDLVNNSNLVEKPKIIESAPLQKRKIDFAECGPVQKLKIVSPSASIAKKSVLINNANLVEKPKIIDSQKYQVGNITECAPFQKRKIDFAECGPVQKLKIVSPSASIAKKSDLINNTNLVGNPKNSDFTECGSISKLKIVSPSASIAKKSDLINNAKLVENPKNSDFTECASIPKLKIVSPSLAKKPIQINNTNLVEKPKNSEWRQYHTSDISSNLTSTTNNGSEIHANLKYPPNKTPTTTRNEELPKRFKIHVEGASETAKHNLEASNKSSKKPLVYDNKNLKLRKSSETPHRPPTTNAAISQVPLRIQLSKADLDAIEKKLEEHKKSLPEEKGYKIHKKNSLEIELLRKKLTLESLERIRLVELEREKSKLQFLESQKQRFSKNLSSLPSSTFPANNHVQHVPKTNKTKSPYVNKFSDIWKGKLPRKGEIPRTTEKSWEPKNASTDEIFEYCQKM